MITKSKTAPKGFAADPLVKVLFAEMKKLGMSFDQLQDGSGVARDTIKQWGYRSTPTTAMMRACLRAVGLDMVAVRYVGKKKK